ncbi:MAG: discoidin domain-containing protein, partial [Bacteroidales bacterium]|nr:discoidin domain-containing protein [Bacteroidales bacterium]
PFDIFCEEILPYRVGKEALENWREKALASFADLNKSFREDSTVTAVEACSRVNALLPQFRLDNDFPSMNYSQLMASARGPCEAMSALAIFSMRALGIPVTFDYTLQWPRSKIGHSWNAVCDSSGRHVSFMGTQSNPGQPHQGTVYTKSKAYRKMFARQNHIQTEEANIPPTLKNPYMKDISHEHARCADMVVPVRFPAAVPTSYAYLATLIGVGEMVRWNPVAWGKVENRHIHYASVGKKLLYLPVYYADHRQTPAGFPFYPDTAGNIRYFEPDSSYKEIILYERGIYYNHMMRDRMIRGRFETADRRDFSDAKILHVITALTRSFNEFRPEHPVACRYVRYVPPPRSLCNVAEIEFYNADGKVLKGTPIGTSGSYNYGMMTFDKAFDGNTSTFYDALSDDSWTGMDFGKRTAIGKIRYHPRKNVMSIESGQTYELLYWNGAKWQSLGKKTAEDACLSFRMPGNALFYMQTVGEPIGNASIFVMEDDMQKWVFQDIVDYL